MRARARLDETTLVPAWKRYTGSLYQAAGPALADVEARGLNMLIISGGYGLVLSNEPIRNYNALLRLASWPRGLLDEVLLDYVRSHQLRAVRAITSSTGDYRKLVERVRWAAGGVEDAMLLCPRRGPGAMVLSPRAQGEALAELLRGTMDANWSSSDGLRIDVHRDGVGLSPRQHRSRRPGRVCRSRHLAHLFDRLVIGQVISVNSASSVGGTS
jgi:hypothetical protein